MKTTFFALLLAAATGVQAQTTSGTITYAVTSRIDMGEMRVVRMENGVRTSGAAAPMNSDGTPMDLPDMIDSKQVISFSGGKVKVEAHGGGPMGGPVMFSAVASTTAAPGGMPVTRSFNPQSSLRPPLSNASYIDLDRKKYQNILREMKDSVVKHTWYSEEDFKEPAALKKSSRTKVIAGYTCHKATAKQGEETFVLWYTTDIPFTYSPVNGVLPEKGVVLSIESSRRSYVAEKVELKPVPLADVSLPADAQQITGEELKEKRRQIMQRFANEQMERFQTQMSAE